MAQLFTNFAAATLASGIGTSDTSISLAAGKGALFPSPSGGDYTLAVITQAGSSETSWEVVKITGRTTDTLTVVRAQEGTTAAAWSAGDKLELRLTAGFLNSPDIGSTTEVTVASAATTAIGAAASCCVLITGTTTITAFDTVGSGITRQVRFAGALTLTHNATSLILPNGGNNITTAAGDSMIVESLGSGNWKVISYQKADGTALGSLPLAGGTLSGDLNFSGDSRRIRGDFSNATVANRLMFQTSTANSGTFVQALPNGTGNAAGFVAIDNSDTTQPFHALELVVGASSGTEVAIRSNKVNGATYLPMTFFTGGFERMRIDTSGNVGFGTNNPIYAVQLVRPAAPAYLASTDGSGLFLAGMNGSNTAIIGTFSNTQLSFYANSAERLLVDTSGNTTPGADNTQTLGSGAKRWSVVYAGTGTINTSDARDKTPVRPLTADEIAAAKQLAVEVGAYRFLDAVAAKGDSSRQHIGMTVQRAIEIMQSHGLDPFGYGFICHDEWAAETEEVVIETGSLSRPVTRQKVERVPVESDEVQIIDGVPTMRQVVRMVDHPVFDQVEVRDANGEVVMELVEPEVPAIFDADGTIQQFPKAAIYKPKLHPVPVMETVEERYDIVTKREAGDRYSFRPDELLLFIARGIDARLTALEAA